MSREVAERLRAAIREGRNLEAVVIEKATMVEGQWPTIATGRWPPDPMRVGTIEHKLRG